MTPDSFHGLLDLPATVISNFLQLVFKIEHVFFHRLEAGVEISDGSSDFCSEGLRQTSFHLAVAFLGFFPHPAVALHGVLSLLIESVVELVKALKHLGESFQIHISATNVTER